MRNLIIAATAAGATLLLASIAGAAPPPKTNPQIAEAQKELEFFYRNNNPGEHIPGYRLAGVTHDGLNLTTHIVTQRTILGGHYVGEAEGGAVRQAGPQAFWCPPTNSNFWALLPEGKVLLRFETDKGAELGVHECRRPN